jgi:hypothetical protein
VERVMPMALRMTIIQHTSPPQLYHTVYKLIDTIRGYIDQVVILIRRGMSPYVKARIELQWLFKAGVI